MNYDDSSEIINEHFCNSSPSNRNLFIDSPNHENDFFSTISPSINDKKENNYSCTSLSKNSYNDINDPTMTLYLIKEKMKKLDRICHSENYDENSLDGTCVNVSNTPLKTCKSPKLRKDISFRSMNIQTDPEEKENNNLLSDEQLNLFQEIQEKNEILKTENEVLKKENDNLVQNNNDLSKKNKYFLKIEKEGEHIKSEFSKILSKFGPQHDSQSIIDMYDEKQEKLDTIKDLLSLSPESDPINEINNLIHEKNKNSQELRKAKDTLNHLIGKFENLVKESEKIQKNFLDCIIRSNKEKEEQRKHLNHIIFITSLLLLVFSYLVLHTYF